MMPTFKVWILIGGKKQDFDRVTHLAIESGVIRLTIDGLVQTVEGTIREVKIKD